MSEQVKQPSAPAAGADGAVPKHPRGCRCIKPKPALLEVPSVSDTETVPEETPSDDTLGEQAPEAAEEAGEDSAEEEIPADAVPPAPAVNELPPVHAISIDIYGKGPSVPPEQRTGPHTVHVPHKVVVDGQPIYLPGGSTVTVTTGKCEATAVTLTMLARRVRVGFEDELDGPVGVPPGRVASADA